MAQKTCHSTAKTLIFMTMQNYAHRVRRFFEKTENRIRQKNPEKPSESGFYDAFESAVKSMHDATRERL